VYCTLQTLATDLQQFLKFSNPKNLIVNSLNIENYKEEAEA
jgi:hypothetical protein